MTKRLQKFYDFFHQPEFKGYCIFTMTRFDFEVSKIKGTEADDIHLDTNIDGLSIYRSDNQKYLVVLGLYADEINDMKKWGI